MAQLLQKSAKKFIAAKISSVKVFAVSKSAGSSALKPVQHRTKKATNIHYVNKDISARSSKD